MQKEIARCVLGASRIRIHRKKRHQLRSTRVRRHTVFDNLAPLAEHSADILVPSRRQTPAQCGFFRSHFLVICVQILARRQPLHVSIGVSSPRVCPHTV